ncbi:unnamed protein product [Phytophthora fragariaefolia]|uniref:Unnamed protein product n=1 Tax=Phytophthora fragariaefolia TaxID=1490495 RepID=A0A9W7D1S7_9STRA|nr:unnamed protein product [Phytophthora fragariaefolia]
MVRLNSGQSRPFQLIGRPSLFHSTSAFLVVESMVAQFLFGLISLLSSWAGGALTATKVLYLLLQRTPQPQLRPAAALPSLPLCKTQTEPSPLLLPLVSLLLLASAAFTPAWDFAVHAPSCTHLQIALPAP